MDINPTQCRPSYTADVREGVAIEYISCEPPENLKELFPEGYNADDDSFEEEETEQAETCSGRENKKVDATKIRYIHLIWHVAPKKIFCFFALSRAFSPS